jgi:UPF0716 protein FxsA
MPIFSFLALFIGLEVYVLVKVWQTYGFVNMAFALVLGAFVGAGLAKSQGRFILAHLKDSVSKSQMPSDRVLHGMLVFIAGLLLVMPGFISDALALVLILPGTRHLAVAYLKRHFKQQVTSGKFRAFTFGAGGAGFGTSFGGGFGGSSGPFASTRRPAHEQMTDEWARDVSPKIIDVIPLSSESTSQSQNQSQNQSQPSSGKSPGDKKRSD